MVDLGEERRSRHQGEEQAEERFADGCIHTSKIKNKIESSLQDFPDNATNKSVSWKSSDEGVATVDRGKTATCTVTVTETGKIIVTGDTPLPSSRTRPGGRPSGGKRILQKFAIFAAF
ncbi:MAG: Ig-like domain-containing protein [Bacteroidales bacterium]|nr:Ig-like domain-containing protein [Bacteroidales bacterium]